jgi:hypothetical protein
MTHQLFPRQPGQSHSKEWQLRCRAHRVLDRARAGFYVPDTLIRWALVRTGDKSSQEAA